MNTETPKTGRGSGRFRLGYGPGATGGDVEIELSCSPASAKGVSIEWLAPMDAVPVEAQRQIISYMDNYLRGYLALHPVGSIHAAVVGASWLTDRRNEPERAAWGALHSAIIDAKLPPPPLYAAPDPDNMAI